MDNIDRTGEHTVGQAHTPDPVVVDHGSSYLAENLRGVCRRTEMSIPSAWLRKACDRGPRERFFQTVREALR